MIWKYIRKSMSSPYVFHWNPYAFHMVSISFPDDGHFVMRIPYAAIYIVRPYSPYILRIPYMDSI